MKTQNTCKVVAGLLLSLMMVISTSIASLAQEKAEPSARQVSTAKKSPVIFKMPNGYMPADFPERKVGKLLLNAKKPEGMFIIYPKDDESSEALLTQLKSVVAGMFFHDSKAQLIWATSSLPAHKKIDNETGTLSFASNEKLEIQLATYTRTFGETVIAYGYYAMRHKGTKDKEDGRFLDSSGGGVESFDKFWKTIQISK